jgi:hypothetical protein
VRLTGALCALSGAANHPAGARPSKCIIIIGEIKGPGDWTVRMRLQDGDLRVWIAQGILARGGLKALAEVVSLKDGTSHREDGKLW